MGQNLFLNFIKVEKESIAVLKSSFLTLFHVISRDLTLFDVI
jgi:hypothetical protein